MVYLSDEVTTETQILAARTLTSINNFISDTFLPYPYLAGMMLYVYVCILNCYIVCGISVVPISCFSTGHEHCQIW